MQIIVFIIYPLEAPDFVAVYPFINFAVIHCFSLSALVGLSLFFPLLCIFQGLQPALPALAGRLLCRCAFVFFFIVNDIVYEFFKIAIVKIDMACVVDDCVQ